MLTGPNAANRTSAARALLKAIEDRLPKLLVALEQCWIDRFCGQELSADDCDQRAIGGCSCQL
jgi:hypothetical protein